MSRKRLPQIGGRLTLPGLRAKVDILRDRWGIPHIFAMNRSDLFLAQGFIHAQERLWQMELTRRAATGRLSELFGELALEPDRAVRTLGLNRLAQDDWTAADPDLRAVVADYTRGINARAEDGNGPAHPGQRSPPAALDPFDLVSGPSCG